MKFIYFTDIHLGEGRDSRRGFELCLESMLAHRPQLLVNGGDLGITPEAVALYRELIGDVTVPVLHSNGNHEMCSGHLPRHQAGTVHSSRDIDGVHFVVLDVVHYFEPTPERRTNWHGLADDDLLAWLEADLAPLDRQTPLVVACHIPLSTTFPFRMGREMGTALPTNEVVNADKVLDLLRPFERVVTLHGHDHENSRHFVDHIEIMTTAAVAGAWWKNGLDSPCAHSREPQGYRLIEVADGGAITNRFIPYAVASEAAEYIVRQSCGRRFVNVFDASPRTHVEIEGLGQLQPIDPLAASSVGMAAHFFEVPADFDHGDIQGCITFEDGRRHEVALSLVAVD
jgi:hypothetical protein